MDSGRKRKLIFVFQGRHKNLLYWKKKKQAYYMSKCSVFYGCICSDNLMKHFKGKMRNDELSLLRNLLNVSAVKSWSLEADPDGYGSRQNSRSPSSGGKGTRSWRILHVIGGCRPEVRSRRQRIRPAPSQSRDNRTTPPGPEADGFGAGITKRRGGASASDMTVRSLMRLKNLFQSEIMKPKYTKF